MICSDCGELTINGGRCYSCEMKARAQRRLDQEWAQNPLVRQLAPPPTYQNPEVVAWLTERCPSRVSPYSGHLEMEMLKTGTAFVELIAAAIEHGRSLGPRMEEATPEDTRGRFDMLEMEDLER